MVGVAKVSGGIREGSFDSGSDNLHPSVDFVAAKLHPFLDRESEDWFVAD